MRMDFVAEKSFVSVRDDDDEGESVAVSSSVALLEGVGPERDMDTS